MKTTPTAPRLLLLAFALAVIPSWLVAQDAPPPPFVLSGTTINYGFRLTTLRGTEYAITNDTFITYNTTAAAAAAIEDTADDTVGWIIRNSGTIGANANGNAPNVGIYLATTGSSTIINEATGFIRGNRSGNAYGAIQAFNGYLTLINAGELRGHVGVRTYVGGYISNSGLIRANTFGVLLYAYDADSAYYPGTLINSGSIIVDSANAAVRMDYWDSIVINNGGYIGVTPEAGAASIGVQIARGGLVENTDGGMIEAKGNAVHLTLGGTVVNTGASTILGSGSSGINILGSNRSYVTNGAGSLIRGAGIATTHAGIYANTAPINVDNSGTIQGHTKGIYMGSGAGSVIINRAGGVIANSATATTAATSGANAWAAISNNTATSGTIINDGVIAGANYGIYIGGAATIINTGTIRGAINPGAIGGAASIYFGSTTTRSTLRLGTGSVLTGDVISASTTFNNLFLEGTGSTAVNFIGGGTTSTTGFNSLAMNGSSWIIGGTVSLTGATASALAVNSGTLIAGNSILFHNAAGAVTVAPGAVLNLATVNVIGSSGTVTNSGNLVGPSGTNANITLGGQLIFSQTGALTYNGIISGSGSVLKTNLGAVTLTGANTYGDTVISAGVLSGRIGRGELTVNASGTYQGATGLDLVAAAIHGSGVINLGTSNMVLNVASGASAYDFTGSVNGTGHFVKTGTGTLHLLGTVSLATDIKNGVLQLDDQALLNTASITLGDTATRGTIDYTGSAAWTKNLSLAGAGGGLGIATGDIALNATLAGAGDFVKTGAGTLDITGATMSNTGNTVVDEGTLRGITATIKGNTTVAAAATIEFNQAANGTYSGNITGAGSLLKAGAGSVNLTGANTYGDTRIAAGLLEGNIGRGTLTVDASGTYRMGASSAVTLAGILGSGAIDLNGNNLVFDVATGDTGTFSFSGALINGNELVKTGAGTLDLATATGLSNTAVKDGALRVNSQSLLGAGSLVLGDTTTHGLIDYTGSAAWTKDVALTGLGGGFGIASGNATLNATVTGAGDFVKDGAGILDIRTASMNHAGNTRVDGGTLLGDAATIKGNTAVASGATIEFNQAANGAYSGIITGEGSLLKTGAGSLMLTGANTYGDTRVSAGLLEGNAGRGTLTVDASGTYKMGASSNVTLTGILGAGTVDLNNNNLILDVAAGVTGTFSFQGSLINGNELVKKGAGTLELTSAISLLTATVEAGALRLDNQSKLGASSITLGSAATRGLLDYTGSDAWTKSLVLGGLGGGFNIDTGTAALNATVTGAGDFVKDGAGTLDITGATMNNTGNTIVDNGTLRGDAATIKGNATVAAGAIVEFAQAVNATHAGTITGAGSLHKSGAGTLILDGPNNYTGDTTISNGMLIGTIGTGYLHIDSQGAYRVGDGQARFEAAGVIGTGTLDLNQADLVLNVAGGATTQYNFNGAYISTEGNTFIKEGAGTLELQAGVALSGGARIREGIVRLANQIFLNTEIILGDNTTAGMLEYTGAEPWAKPIRVNGAGGGFATIDNDVAFTGAVSGDGLFIKDGARTLDITGAIFGNAIRAVVNAGELVGNSHSMPLAVDTKPGASIEFNQVSDGYYNGVITGGGALRKTGPGVLTLTQQGQYTAQTWVGDGALRAGAPDIWRYTSRVETADSGAIDMGGFDQRVGTLINGGAIIFNATVNATAGVIYSADKLIITGTASGNGKIRVNLNEAALDGAPWTTSAVLLDIDGLDNSNYTAEFDGRRVVGAYDWTVAKKGSSYVLSADQLSPEVPAIGALDAATILAGRASIAGIGRRLMAVRDNPVHDYNVWADAFHRGDKLFHSLYDHAKARTHGFQGGAHWNNQRGSRPVTVGLFLEYIRTSMEIDGRTSTSHTDSTGGGLYASYRSEDSPIYANVILRGSKEDYTISVPAMRDFTTDGSSIAVSIEVGGRLPVESAWIIEPQVQASVQKHSIDDPTDSVGRTYAIKGASALEGRAGVRLWRETTILGKRLFPSIRASFVYEWDGRSRVEVAGIRFKNHIGGAIGELDAGAMLEIARQFTASAGVSYYAGAKLNGFTINASAAIHW